MGRTPCFPVVRRRPFQQRKHVTKYRNGRSSRWPAAAAQGARKESGAGDWKSQLRPDEAKTYLQDHVSRDSTERLSPWEYKDHFCGCVQGQTGEKWRII